MTHVRMHLKELEQSCNVPSKELNMTHVRMALKELEQSCNVPSKELNMTHVRMPLKELEQSCNVPSKELNMTHVRMALKETFTRRWKWISEMTDGGIAEILQKFPTFEYGKLVSNLFSKL